MRLNYTIIDSLDFFKGTIKKLEKDLNAEPTKAGKLTIESIIVWNLERAFEMLNNLDESPAKTKLKQWFLKEQAQRPDIIKLTKLFIKNKT